MNAQTSRILGMTPEHHRACGRRPDIVYAVLRTPVGRLLIGATDRGICCIRFGDSPRTLIQSLRAEYPRARVARANTHGNPRFAQWTQAVVRHLAGGQPRPDVPLDLRGTAFQIQVWRCLQAIPYGERRSYAQVAAAVGRPRAVRAVAQACARNPIALLVPCHRVVCSSGDVGGYRGGVHRKAQLLAWESRARPAAVGLALDP